MTDTEIIKPQPEEKKNKGSFKERYQTDEAYRKHHLEYCNTKIMCDCGEYVRRVSHSSHCRTAKHKQKLELLAKKDNTKTIELYSAKLVQLEQDVKFLKDLLETIKQ